MTFNAQTTLLRTLTGSRVSTVSALKLMCKRADVVYTAVDYADIRNLDAMIAFIVSAGAARPDATPLVKEFLDQIEIGSVGCGSEESGARLDAYRELLAAYTERLVA